MSLFSDIQSETSRFAEPLVFSMTGEQEFVRFLAGFGYTAPPRIHGNLRAKAVALETALTTFASAAPSSADAVPLFGAIVDICQDPALIAVVGHGPAFLAEVFDSLLEQYLSTFHGLVYGVLMGTGVRKVEAVPVGGAGGRDFDYTRVSFDWAKLADFISATS